MPPLTIRTYGDPVLRQHAAPVADIDGSLRQLVEGMIEALQTVHGAGLAAPQVGVAKRLFVSDIDDAGPRAILNPTVAEKGGEWTYDEGCLSVPGLYFTVLRPREVLLTGWDLDGNELHIEASDLEARLYQHELDHLDGTLVLEHLQPAQRKAALRLLRERQVADGRAKIEPVTIGLDGEIVEQ